MVKATSELELAELDLHTYLTYTHPKELEQRQADGAQRRAGGGPRHPARQGA